MVTPPLSLEQRRGRFSVELAPSDPRELVVEIRGHRAGADPSRRMGTWRFELPTGAARLDVELDFAADPAGVVKPSVEGTLLRLLEHEMNGGYVVEPVQNVILTRGGREDATVLLNETDQAVLAGYAQHVHRVDGYMPKLDAAREFVLVFHGSKLRQLKRLFGKHIPPGSRVADVGAGRSMFAELVEWRFWRRVPYRVVCSDVAIDVMAARKREVPDQEWLAADTTQLPLLSGRFDALFAGEILEHVTDPAAVLREWVRLVRPGGVLVITTPNRKRITNRVNRADTPMGPDHVSELTYPEALALFRSQGLEVLEACGVYLELDLQWRKRGPKMDLAPMRQFRGRGALLTVLNWLGRPFPSLALDVIYVLRRPTG